MSEKKTYESAVKELEDIVNELEKGECTMDEAFKKYENGIKLVEFCEKYLSEKEAKLKAGDDI